MNISNNHLSHITHYLQTPDLVEGIIKPGSIGYLYGESGKGKSFITLYLAYCVATGRDWRTEQKVNKARKVLYIAAEGELDFTLRRHILEEYYKENAPNLYILPQNVTITEEGVAEIKSAIESSMGSADLIVIDTLSQTNPATESNEDLATYLRLVASLKAPSASVLIVHHTGIDTSRSRGGTALAANTDYRLRVDGDIPFISLSSEKVKAGPIPEPQQFQLLNFTSEDMRLRDYQGKQASSLVANPYVPFDMQEHKSTEDIFNSLVLALDNRELEGRDDIANFIRREGFRLKGSEVKYTKFATLIKEHASDGKQYYKADGIKESTREARKNAICTTI